MKTLIYSICTVAALDITWADVLEGFTNNPKIYRDYSEIDDYNLETIEFNSLDSICEFLTKAPSILADTLATSTGDDSYYDYTWSFLAQYREILEGLIPLSETLNPNDFKDDTHNWYLVSIQIPRLITLNKEIFNRVILEHQDNDGYNTHQQISGKDYDAEINLWYAAEIEPLK